MVTADSLRLTAHGRRILLVCVGAVLSLLVADCGLLGLEWDVLWEREFAGDTYDWLVAYDMAAAPDGGVMMVGTTTAWGAVEYDALVVRLDRRGGVVARKLLGGPYSDMLRVVRSAPAGGYIAGGEHTDVGWLVRLDEDGDTLWTRSFGDSASNSSVSAVTPTGDGGFAAGGTIGRQGSAGSFVLIRTDASGTELWRREWGWPDLYGPRSLLEQPDGGFLVSAWPGTFIRTDANGDTVWTRRVSFGHGFDLCAAPGGGFYGAGDSSNWSLGPQYIVTARFDTNGETLWTRKFREDFVQSPAKVVTALDSGCIVFGTLGTIIEGGDRSNALILKYSTDGRLEWVHTLGSDRSDCGAGVAGADGWLTAAVGEDPLQGRRSLTVIRTRP